MSFIKIKELNKLINKHSSNIITVSDNDLEFLLGNYYDLTDSVQALVLAEILTRYWLYSGNYNLNFHNIISQKQIKDFFEITQSYRKHSQEKLAKNIELPFSNLTNKKLISSLDKYLTCDGIIPVVFDGLAYAIPFKLVKNGNLDKLIVSDIKNHKIENWSNYINELKSFGITNWKIQLFIEENDDIPFEGHSLELPVLMAIEKKESKFEYPPLEVLATGSFAFAGKLSNVEGIEAKLELSKKINPQLFFIPEQDKKIEDTIAISTNFSDIETIDFIKNKLIENGLSKLTWREAKTKLAQLDNDVHFGIISLEKSAIPQIERYERIFEEENKIEQLLISKALKAAVYCHLGKTDEAFKLNNECLTLANKSGEYKIYINCATRQIVNLTDLGNFKEAFKQAEFIEKIITENKIKDPDILMKFNGTFGQALLYNNLSNTIPQKTLGYFQKAANLADNQAGNLAKNLKQSNICQDLNYIHLYHTISNFNSEQEINAYKTAKSAIFKLLPEQQKRNFGYLYRQKAFGAYRDYLNNGNIYDDDLQLPSHENAEGWTLAMTLKYTGALKVAQGKLSDAKSDFENGFIALCKDGEFPLLTLLKMTIKVQAWSSLKDTEFAEFANKCYDEALHFFSNDEILNIYHFAKDWKEYLENKGKSMRNPQLNFQY